MENQLNRKKIADEVYFTSVTDKKFKTNRVTVTFITKLSDETASENAVISRMLTICNAKLDTMAKMNRRLSELYSSGLSWFVSQFGDNQICQLSASVLDNRYALEGEDILHEVMEILIDCIFSPYFENGFFPKQSLELEKQNQIDENNSEINDKTRYASMKARSEAFKGEPAAINWGGTNEQVSAITDEAALGAYRRMIREMRAEIICVGESDFAGIGDMFAEAFAKADRHPEAFEPSVQSKAKPEVSRVTETLDIEQSKLVMIFKTPLTNNYPLDVMANLYGGTESSRLFLIVREKMSLCYYCYSRYGDMKGIVSVECGVELDNIERAEKECLGQLTEIANGSFTDEEIEKVKLHMINGIRSMTDTTSGITVLCLKHILVPGHSADPEQEIENIKAVTKEEIVEAAGSLILDTVYTLRSTGKEAEI